MKKFDEKLWLLTPEEFQELLDGVKMLCINDSYVVKGIDYIDQDIRFGCLAYGFTKELAEQQNLEHDFLFFMLRS